MTPAPTELLSFGWMEVNEVFPQNMLKQNHQTCLDFLHCQCSLEIGISLSSLTSYLTALCLSSLTHQIHNAYLPSLPHKLVGKIKLDYKCENALKIFLKCHKH